MRKLCLLLTLVAGFSHFADAKIRPTLSLLGSRTVTINNTQVQSGAFEVINRKCNLGFELTNKFALGDKLFFKTGIRYQQSKTVVNGLNQITTVFDKPDPMTWEKHYEAITVPLHIGREFSFGRGRKAEVYGGLSLGVFMVSSATISVSSDFPRNINNTDVISGEIRDSSNQTEASFMPNVDIGFNYHPSRYLPRLGIGVMGSLQLSRTPSAVYQGLIKNETSGQSYPYYMKHSQRLINASVVLSYSFGKRSKL